MSQKSLTIFKTCKIVQRLYKFAKGIEVLKNSSKKIKILRKYWKVPYSLKKPKILKTQIIYEMSRSFKSRKHSQISKIFHTLPRTWFWTNYLRTLPQNSLFISSQLCTISAIKRSYQAYHVGRVSLYNLHPVFMATYMLPVHVRCHPVTFILSANVRPTHWASLHPYVLEREGGLQPQVEQKSF